MTDRVAIVPGPPSEVAMVRRIFQHYVEHGLSDRRIAALLRKEGASRMPGVPWSAIAVRRILVNPRYCGDLLYNKTTRRMGKAISGNHAADWICCHDALPPIVERTVFERAQEIRRLSACGPQREAVLQQLRNLYERHGTISIQLCRRDPAIPGGHAIVALFGGYLRAYAAAGLPPLGTATGALHHRTSRLLADNLLDEVRRYAVLAGGTVSATAWNNIVLLNDRVLVKVAVAACCRNGAGRSRWRVPLRLAMPADFVLCGPMDGGNQGIERYILLSSERFFHDAMFITERNIKRVANECHHSLAQVFGLSADASAV